MQLPRSVEVVEVGPRDGLQNESVMVSTGDKIDLLKRLTAAGLKRFEATSFVSPKWIPQLADAAEVITGLPPVHDTRGLALANVVAALDAGIRTFDASVGGLGGCPFAPGAAGNVATEDLVYMFSEMGIETGIDLERLLDVSDLVGRLVEHPVRARINRSLLQWKCAIPGPLQT